jgi:hypothetical protein
MSGATREHDKDKNVLRNTTQLRVTIQNKGHEMLICGVVLLHDNAGTHTVARVRALLENFYWELFDHPP